MHVYIYIYVFIHIYIYIHFFSNQTFAIHALEFSKTSSFNTGSRVVISLKRQDVTWTASFSQ